MKKNSISKHQNSKKYHLILFLLLLIIPSLAFSQISISGKVTDKENNPLIGVAVLLDGLTENATVTDLNGEYFIRNIEGNNFLVFSLIGYEIQKIEINNQTIINLELVEGVALDEIVVTALGLERSSKALGYSLQKLEGTELNQVQAVNFVDNLGAKVAGVQVTAGASGLGSTSKITIRGESSFANNNPLFVVDGIPINNRTVLDITNEPSAGFQEIDWGN